MNTMVLDTGSMSNSFFEMLKTLFTRLNWETFIADNNNYYWIINVPEDDLSIWEEMEGVDFFNQGN